MQPYEVVKEKVRGMVNEELLPKLEETFTLLRAELTPDYIKNLIRGFLEHNLNRVIEQFTSNQRTPLSKAIAVVDDFFDKVLEEALKKKMEADPEWLVGLIDSSLKKLIESRVEDRLKSLRPNLTQDIDRHVIQELKTLDHLGQILNEQS